jgi:iron-sulfur cluster assembly protein
MSLSSQKLQPPIIELTDSARDKVFSLMDREGKSRGAFLRVSVVGGGCSGFSYKMSFEDEAAPNDHDFISNQVNVIVDPKSALFISGLRINFEDGLNGAGFVYENPKASKSCGCGTSFSV